MKKIILLSLTVCNILMAVDFSVNSVTNVSNTYDGLANKKDLNNVYTDSSTYDKTTIFEGWSENIVQNGTFEDTSSWNLLSGSGFKAEIKNGVGRDNNPFMFGTGPDFIIGQDKYTKIKPYFKYALIDYEYAGDSNASDESQVLLDVYDINDNLLGTINGEITTRGTNWVLLSDISYVYNDFNASTSDRAKAAKFVVKVKTTNQDGGALDTYMDNLSVKLLSDTFYADNTNIKEKIIYPTVYPYIDMYGNKGNNYFYPDDAEGWSESLDITTSDVGDYVVLPVGNILSIWGGDGDDTMIAYQGNQISNKEKLQSYNGDDKLYLPLYGTNHLAKGGNGWDTVVLRGNKSDYTITHHSSAHDDYTISNSNMSARVYECEQICFTNKNPLTEPDGNVKPSDMDCYVFKDDGTEDIVNTNLPATVDGKTTSNYVTNHRIQVNNINIQSNLNVSGTVDIYLTNLPVTLKSFKYADGTIVNTNLQQNGAGEDKNTIKLTINGTGTTTFEFTDIDYNTSTTPIDMSNVVITRALPI